MRCDKIWTRARLATLIPATDGGLGLIGNGVIAAKDGRIVFAGDAGDAPAMDAGEIVDCEGRLVTPGLIDCHTHLVYGGSRAREFEMRLDGASYEDI
ncbi:MAG TPA: amidohydrolase family protein, partial [Rhizomicrobium sp.]|nr:amidohydrolase family protein [Rhizomicrobium sp.]